MVTVIYRLGTSWFLASFSLKMLALKTSRNRKLYILQVLLLGFWVFWYYTSVACNTACSERNNCRRPGSRRLVLWCYTVRDARGIISIWRSWGSKELPENDQRNHLPFPSVGYHNLLQLLVWWIWKQFKCVSCACQRILGVQYSFPDYVRVSSDCRRLLSQIFVADPSKVLPLSVE